MKAPYGRNQSSHKQQSMLDSDSGLVSVGFLVFITRMKTRELKKKTFLISFCALQHGNITPRLLGYGLF